VLIEVPYKNILECTDEAEVFFIHLAATWIKHGCTVSVSFSLKKIRNYILKLTP
jgi:hypothetical protein